MLRPSSSHYYACYYALLCLLYYHQQQALAVTIVIDGATTNEWATKDEYQRLVDSSQGQLAAESGSSGATGDKLKQHHHQQHPHQQPKQLQLQLHHQRQQLADATTNTKQNAEQSLEQMLRSFNGGTGDQSGASKFRLIPASRPVGDQASDDGIRVVAGGAARRLFQELNDAASTGHQQQLTWPSSSSQITASRSPTSAEADDGGNSNNYNNNNNNQDNSFRNPASSPNDRDELELALDRLDLIERERKVQLKQLKQLESLERTVETGLAAALSRASLGNGGGAAGARSISDLVSPTDTDLEFSWRTHGKGNGAFRRETTGSNRYCGDDFIDLAHHICNGSFANPYDPIIVQPKVSKRKRSVGYPTKDFGSEDDEPLLSSEPGVGLSYVESETSSSGSLKPTVARQRKLRTLQATNFHEGDGESSSSESLSTSSSSVHDGNIGNQNHNHNHQKKQQQQQQQRYLSKSNFINNDDINNNNLSANRNRQARSDSTRLRLARDIDAPSNICCKKQCNWDDIKELYCKREPAES